MKTIHASAQDQVRRLETLLRNEHIALVDFLFALSDFDEKELYLPLGYSSTWAFLREGLGQSEAMTHYRLSAARLLRRLPKLGDFLRQGKVCMTHLSDLAPVLNDENCEAIVTEAMGKSREDIKRIVARLQPRPVPKAPSCTTPLSPAPRLDSPPTPQPAASIPVQTEILTEAFARKHITIDREYEELLKGARDALSHTSPNAAELDVIKEGLRRIIRDHQKRKGQTERPRAPKEPKSPEAAIPAHIKRQVWQRDKGQCQWPRPDGQICGSTFRVQFHHRIDRGKGGAHSLENVVLTCQQHNLYAAELSWGKNFIDEKRMRNRVPRPGEANAPNEGG